MDKIKSTLQKIKALADGSPIQHERDAALKKLTELMEKYNISEDDFADDAVATRNFKYRNTLEKKLLQQIFAKVLGRGYRLYGYRSNNRKLLELGADCSVSQKIEIELYFDFYKNLYKREETIFFTAFINKHGLYSPPGDSEETESEHSERDEQEIAALFAYMRGMSDESPHKRIESSG